MLLRGVDISHYQSNAIYKDLFNLADFFLLKASEGKSYYDLTCKTRQKELVVNGKCVGLYHFWHDGVDPALQWQNFYKRNQYPTALPIILDIEPNKGNKMTHTYDWAKIKRWCNTCMNVCRRKPVLYMSYADYVAAPAWTKDYPVWVARYKLGLTFDQVRSYGDNVIMWQYTDGAKKNGYTKFGARNFEVDGDMFAGSYSEFMNLGK